MIAPGTRLGPYEIIAPLGAGGMGQVYRARDLRLHREVALKVLPSAAALDPERQRRFEQEARAAAALNHPNILGVHDVGAHDGTPYIVSELIDGESLRMQIERHIIPLRKLVDFAAQIADGLAAAHEAGIVHRDLKPENVMVTRDGRVKILDFGLAKALSAESPAAGASPPTQTTELLVGTVPYMSPEQARGAPIDFRSDQFSFALVLYEMATGTRAFQRETQVQTLSAIVAEEAPPIAELNPRIPAPLQWIIERCLLKDPADRYAATRDLARDLHTVRDRWLEITSGSGPATRSVSRRRRVAWLVAATVIAAAILVFGFRVTSAPIDLRSYTLAPFANDSGYQGKPAWSPDGKTLAYVAEVDGVPQIFTRSLTSSLRAQITHALFDCRDPFWSPDGTRIYYFSLAGDKDALWSVSVAGGTPERVLDEAQHAALSPDGQTLAIFKAATQTLPNLELFISAPPGAEPRQFVRPPFDRILRGIADSVLHFSPDGSKLLVWWTRGGGLEPMAANREFYIVPMPEGTPYPVLQSLAGPQSPPLFSWLPDNRHIVIELADERMPGTRLWIADTERDTARPLTIGTSNEGAPAVSPDGQTVAFTSEGTDFDLVLVGLDGTTRTFFSTTRNEIDPVWSPTTNQFAFVTDRTGHQEIWLRHEDGTSERAIVTEQDFGGTRTLVYGALAFSPDGARLAYQRFGPEGYQIWISQLAGGPAVRVNLADPYQDSPTWSPDGDSIAYVTRTEQSWVLARTRAGGSAAPEIIGRNIIPFSRVEWSPDGRWILCDTADGLSLVSPDGKTVRLLSEDVWLAHAWSADATTVYGLRLTDDLHHFLFASIDVLTHRERVIQPNIGPIPLANQPIRGFSRVTNRGFLFSIARVKSDIWLLRGFQPPRGFFDSLRDLRAPARP